MRSVLREQLGVGPDPESVALYEEVLAFEGRGVPTPAERARALLAWATIHWEQADLDEAERTATEVRALAVDAGLGRELAGASELLGLIAYTRGRWQEVFAREFLATIRLTPELAPFVYDANMCMSEFALHQRDGLKRLSQFADDLLTVADEADSAQARGLGLLLQGEVGLLAGSDPSGVAASLRGARRLHRATASDRPDTGDGTPGTARRDPRAPRPRRGFTAERHGLLRGRRWPHTCCPSSTHAADLRIQGKYGAQYINYWLDTDQRKIFCLVEAPDADAAHAVHREAHGLVADEIYEVHQGEPHGAADGVDAV